MRQTLVVENLAPDLKGGQYELHVDLLGGLQWVKGKPCLLVEGSHSSQEEMLSALSAWAKKMPDIRCPKDRKAKALIADTLKNLHNLENSETMFNGVNQFRITEKAFRLTLYFQN